MNLFGEDFLIDVQENTVKDLVKKLSGKNGEEVSPEKLLKSKKLTLEERLNIITDKVLKTLAKQKDNIIVIKNDVYLNRFSYNRLHKVFIYCFRVNHHLKN